MAKLVVVAVLLFAAALSIPQTRPTVLTYSEPVLYPVFLWQTKSEMERIGAQITNFENQYYKLPTSAADFPKYMEHHFTEKKARIDSWSTEYRLKIWPDSIGVISAGPDRKHGTEDDIAHTLLRLAARLNQR